jgi:enediyne biosynthesis protein E4
MKFTSFSRYDHSVTVRHRSGGFQPPEISRSQQWRLEATTTKLGHSSSILRLTNLSCLTVGSDFNMYDSNSLSLNAMARTSLVVLMCVLGFGCSDTDPAIDTAPADVKSSNLSSGLADQLPSRNPKISIKKSASSVRFTNIQSEAGIDYKYANGETGEKLMVASTGGGAGWIDFDLDGLIDIYFPQGGNPATTKDNIDQQPTDRLYRNAGTESGVTDFVDVSSVSIPIEKGYGQGIAVGDYDNDGFPDIYVTNVGSNKLFRNLGDGTFEDVTDTAGIDNKLWSTSCAWCDIDLDGDLDLWLCNYLIYDPYDPPPCRGDAGEPATCHPAQIKPQPNELFINNGDGTFSPVYKKWNLAADGAKSLGVAVCDFNRDGWPDIFVANDTTSNFLYLNLGLDPKAPKGERRVLLKESGYEKGCAISGLGQFQASMGIGFGDYDKNGFQDLYISHFTSDSNTLYANLGSSGFHDLTRECKLHKPVFNYLAFGTVMVDFNCDRNHELLIANGHIDDWRHISDDMWKMPAQLFSYNGSVWDEHSKECGKFFEQEWIGRGVATADFDNDNDVDVLVVNQNDPVGLLRNDSDRGHWLRVRLVGVVSNRDAFNAIVTVKQGGESLVQERAGGTSYCASHERVLTFGLGQNDKPCTIEIKWPTGETQILTKTEVDQSIVVVEATSKS